MVERRNNCARGLIARPAFNRERALPGSRAHLLRPEPFSHPLRLPQPVKPRRSKNNCVVLAFLQLAQPRVYVTAEFADI